jgi:predicted Rossmann fold nucleotide-binding protein DprA/Smf involved in DNA uptake
MTFGSGYKTYYKQIVDGDVLVVSVFNPKAPWRPELAMARNPIIYGLADEIYVAESSDKGGTWSGVVDGLRKSRKIYVRKPEASEDNANNLLIQKGAVAVDFNGTPLPEYKPIEIQSAILALEEAAARYENKIIELLGTGEYPAKEILKRLQLDWTENKLRDYLKSHKEVETIEKRPLRYTLKNRIVKQKSLFD